MKRLSGDVYALKVLNVLMTHQNGREWFSTNELCELVGCERKTIYRAVDVLETSGFGIEVKKGTQNKYKYRGLYGFA